MMKWRLMALIFLASLTSCDVYLMPQRPYYVRHRNEVTIYEGLNKDYVDRARYYR